MSERTEAFKQELNALLKKYDCELLVDPCDGDEKAYFFFSGSDEDLEDLLDWKICD